MPPHAILSQTHEPASRHVRGSQAGTTNPGGNVTPFPRQEVRAPGIPVRSKSAAVVLLAGTGDDARVLIMQRAGKTSRGLWSLVMGGVEAGETAPQAVRREIREEAGVEAGDLYNSGCCDTFFNPGANSIDITPIFVATFAAAPTVTINEEHLAYRWVSFAEAQDMIAFPGQRQALAEIERDFARREPPAFRLMKA